MVNIDNSIVFFENYEDFYTKMVKPTEREPSISRKSFSSPATSQISVRLFTGTYLSGSYDYQTYSLNESQCISRGYSKDFAHSTNAWPNISSASSGAKSFSAVATKTSGADWESYAQGYIIFTDLTINFTPILTVSMNLNGGAVGNLDLTVLNLSPLKAAEVLATYF